MIQTRTKHTHTYTHTHIHTYIQSPLVDAFFAASFEQGHNISTFESSVNIAESLNIDGVDSYVESQNGTQTFPVHKADPDISGPPAIIVRSAGNTASFPAILGVVSVDKIVRVISTASEKNV